MSDEPLEAEQLTSEEIMIAGPPPTTGPDPEKMTGFEVPPLPEGYKEPRDDKMVVGAVLVVLLLIFSLAWVSKFWEEDEEIVQPPAITPFDDVKPIPGTTFYHFDGGIDAVTNESMWSNLNGSNVPFRANGTYYGIQTHTFEPTIGITSSGNIFMTSHRGAGDGTSIIRSTDYGQTWADMTPNPQPVPNSNDPYVYVDPWTDRIVKFDMHVLLGMFFEFSDDEGETWSPPREVTGKYTPQDHQTIASMPAAPHGYPTSYPTIYVYSINTGLQGGGVGGSYGQNSFTGGTTWNEPQIAHYEIGKSPCHGLSGHLVGANDGAIYRGQPSCEGPAVYRSIDGGFTWTEHTITPDIQSESHEIAVGTDEDNNVHAFWVADNDLPYYSNSQDQGNTWREPMMVAPPGVVGSGFPTVAGGSGGRVAFSYIGTNNNGAGPWNGYLGMMTDAFAEEPLITTMAVNAPDDPLDTSDNCGNVRCGGFGDFIDIAIDLEGRPWAALAHNPDGETGIVGTFWDGPALRGDLDYVDRVLEPGGPSTLGQTL